MSLKIEEKFKLSFRDIFYNPYFIIRRELYNSIKNNSHHLNGNLMDFGCGTRPYESLFIHVKKYVGVDFEGGGNDYEKNNVDVYYDGKTLPFSSDEFDSILTTEVIEHIFNPDQIVPELNRVLKSGGKLMVTCPFCWPEHEQPWDYARYSSFGIKHLLEKHDFKIVSQEKTANFFLSIVQLVVLYNYMFIPKIKGLKQVLFLIFCFPFLVFGLSVNFFLPAKMKRKDLYLNNLIIAQKL